MKKPKPSRSVADLIALVDSIIAYWKSIAEVNFKKTSPDAKKTSVQTQTWLNLSGCGQTSSTTSFLRRPSARQNGCERFHLKAVTTN
jgi:hypothetical protein